MARVFTSALSVAIGLSGAALSGPSGGVSAAQASIDALDEVVVSARKRAENAQDVPISMSVRSAEVLADSNTFRMQEILRSMPNVSTEVQHPRQASIAIRGLGKNPANDGLEASVGVFLDGVYLGRSGMVVTDLIDIERVEVLRGPQGTLFGKNTTAGAFNIVTRAPGEALETFGQLSLGNRDFSQISGAINAPLVPQRLAFRLSAFETNRAGFIFDDTLNTDLGEFDRHGARAQLLWTPDGRTRLRLIADYNSQDEDGPGYMLLDPGIIMADGSVRPNNFLDRSARAGYTLPGNPFARRTDAEAMQRATADQAGVSLQADVQLGDSLLTSISAWRKWNFQPTIDGDYTAMEILPETGVGIRHHQFSQEIRLSSAADSTFAYLLGAYYFSQDIESTSDSLYGRQAADFMTQGLTPLALDGFRVVTFSDPETESLAAFVQGTWRPTKSWELTAGARFTTEQREAHITRRGSGGAAVPAGSAAALARERLGGFVATEADTSEDFVSGLLSARYTITADMMAYVSLSRGAKSGGINVAIVPAGVSQTLEPEIANNVEVGWKSQWLGDTLQLNIATFWMEVDDYQTTQRDRLRNTAYLANAGTVRSRGFEVESVYRPMADLELGLAGGWNDATYTSFTSAPCPVETVNPTVCDFTGQHVVGAPPWTATASVRYGFPVGAGGSRLFADAEYTHTPSYKLDMSDYTLVQAFGLANLQLGIEGRDDRWRAWVWSRNLLDKDYFTTMATAGAFGSGAVAGLIGDPRTFGVSVRARF